MKSWRCSTLFVFLFSFFFCAKTFGQATVTFNNRVVGQVFTHVYFTLNPHEGVIGNGSDDSPSGTTSYAGFSLIGANGTGGRGGAATTFAQLLAASGDNAPENTLIPSLGVTTFRTGARAGTVMQIVSTLVGIPQNAPAATIEMVAWDNSSGLYSTWATASVAWGGWFNRNWTV